MAARTKSARSCSAISAVLRTSELLSAHRIDGAEQYFTRAIDYGYSFDPQEVIDKWGRKDIVGDYVRLIRTLRPDVVLTMNIQGRGGDRAHEATTILVREAWRAAGDPSMYPGADQGRAAALAAEEAVLHFVAAPPARGKAVGRGGRGGAGRGDPAPASGPATRQLPRLRCRNWPESTPRRTIRCSAAPTPRSAPMPAAITSARA